MLRVCTVCAIVLLLKTNDILSRSVDSVNDINIPSTMDVTDRIQTMNLTSNAVTTEKDLSILGTMFATPRTFDICEKFGIENDIDLLGMRNRGVTVVTKLF